MVVLVGLNLAYEYRTAVARARTELGAIAAAVAGNQASILAGTHDLLLGLANRRSVDEQDLESCAAEMVRLQEKAIGVLNAGLIQPDRGWFCSALPATFEAKRASERSWFRDALADDALAVGGYQIGRVTGKPSINIALSAKTPKGDRVISFVALDLAWLQRTLLSRMELPPDSYLLVMDRAGTVVTGSPQASELLGHSMEGTPLGEIIHAAAAQYFEIESNGVPSLAAVQTVGLGARPDLFVVVTVPLQSITARPLEHFYFSLTIVLATTALVLVLAWFIADRGVVRPIELISTTATRLGGGETGVRVNAAYNVREIAALGRSFDEMAAGLEERSATLAATIRESQSAHSRLDAVIGASPAAIICLDRTAKVTLWNPAAERLFGWPAEAVLGLPHPVVPPSEREHFVTRFERTLAGEEIIGARATRMKRDGTLVEVDFNSGPLLDEAGQCVGVVYVVNDLTEQILTERQLHQAQKMEAIGQLTGGVAHDFNNLLGVMIGNLEFITELSKNAEIREFAQVALDAGLRGGELTRQLLAFARRQPLQPEPIDPAETIRTTARMLDRTLGDRVTLRLEMPAGIWRIIADPTQLESAIVNLAVNARDAMPNGGTLLIELANAQLAADSIGWDGDLIPGDYVQIAVSDTGIGMTSDVAARAFDPFFTTKGPGRGTGLGLGLSMVYGFIKQSGGQTRIYSEPDHGTTIKLWLPRAVEAAEARADDQPAPGNTVPRGTETILVVEDSAAIRSVVTLQLTNLGYRTIEAADGHAALDILKQRDDIDLLFTDVMMPGGIDGHMLAREALALRPGVRVLYTSGFSGDLSAESAAFAQPLLSKPYRRRQLAEKLREVLGG